MPRLSYRQFALLVLVANLVAVIVVVYLQGPSLRPIGAAVLLSVVAFLAFHLGRAY